MTLCEEFKKHIVDYHEGVLAHHKYLEFEEHVRCCGQCQGEYDAFKKLREVLDSDEVVFPAQEFFDDMRRNVRQKQVRAFRRDLPKLARVLVPVCAAAAIVLIATRRERTAEMTIAPETFLADEDVASLTLSTIVNDTLIGELSVIESDYYSDVDELIEGLTDEEQSAFLNALHEKYGNGT